MADKSTPEGERIAKVLSRRGIASRREAERLIEAGEVAVNGKVITSPALNVTEADRITVSGKPLPELEPPRLWLYYKPEGLVTSASDEKGRDTVFDHLPEDMPRVMSVGRLDLNSEGLLLLTNDGELKRRLELPSTGWLRKYRVRVNGAPDDVKLQPLRDGITVEGERFQPMQVTLDRVQGANAWLTVGLREGKNREIRRAMNAIGLYVNRLIRVSYGPFRLGELEPGQVEEVRQKVLRDQLGEDKPEGDGRAKSPVTRKLAPRRTGEREGAKPASGKPAAGKPAVRTEAKTASARPAAKGRESVTLPKPVRPGDGVRALSAAWKTAVTPRLDAEPERPARPARTRSTERPDGPATRGTTAKPAARAGKASPKAEAKAGARSGVKTGPKDEPGRGTRPPAKPRSKPAETAASAGKTGGRPATRGTAKPGPTSPAGGRSRPAPPRGPRKS